MNALADKAHKQGMPHSDMHALHNTWPRIQQPSSNGYSATYVGMVVE